MNEKLHKLWLDNVLCIPIKHRTRMLAVFERVRNEAFEEAAKVAEPPSNATAVTEFDMKITKEHLEDVARCIAQRIRALKKEG